MANVKELSDKGPDGTRLGQSAADLIAFYGTTPVSQRASSVQATIATVASSTDFAAAQQGAVNSAITTLNEVTATLTALGLWKGGA